MSVALTPGGTADDTLWVARVTDDADGQTLAVIVNYACHPTTLAWQNTLISPDFPGALRELVEQYHPGVCVFLQGTSGDLAPRHNYVGDPAIADRNGRQLGFAVLSVIESLPPAGSRDAYVGAVVSRATLGVWDYESDDEMRRASVPQWQACVDTLRLPLRSDLPTLDELVEQRTQWEATCDTAIAQGDDQAAADARAQTERVMRMQHKLTAIGGSDQLDLSIAMWRAGDAIWVALDSEYYQILQTSLRGRHPGVPIIVTTLTNGWRASYFPPQQLYGQGIYAEQVAMLAPGCLEAVIEAIDQRINQWVGSGNIHVKELAQH